MKRSTAVVMAFITLAGVGAWYLLSSPAEKIVVPHVAIVVDRSNSLRPDPEGKVIAGLVERALEVPRLAKDSTITITATGDEFSAAEPVLIATIAGSVSSGVWENRGKTEKERRALVDEIVRKFLTTAPETDVTPVFLAVKRALAQLRAAGCEESTGCVAYIKTDGEENSEPWLKDSIKARKLLKKGRPAPLDNRGIRVMICGLSEARGVPSDKRERHSRIPKHDAALAEFMIEMWTSLFTAPDLVSFQPLCATAEVFKGGMR